MIKKFATCGAIDAGNCVNMAQSTEGGMAKMSVRYHSKIGVLSKIFDCLASNEVNVMEMQNLVFKEREAAVCNL